MKLPEAAIKAIKKWLVEKDAIKPTLSEFSVRSDICSTSPSKIVHSSITWNGDSAKRDVPEFIFEFRALEKELTSRYLSRKIGYDRLMGICRNSAFLIYVLIRSLRPRVVHETGVANGISSFFILNALNRNGLGELYSFDLSKNVGHLLNQDEKDRWSLFELDRKNIKESFRLNLRNMPCVDFFLHDSDHSYKVQMFEYSTVNQRINEKGILASDDVDGSYAFLDFCSLKGLKPYVLVENRKVFGLMRKQSSRS
jgi:predicted O-methyltransferase YrrM